MKKSNIEINSVAQVYIDRITAKCAKLKPLVVIDCLTYNHEDYLRDALEGFVLQKTDFPFVAIVHEDASTDGTATILREYAERYPDIILPIFETGNQYYSYLGSIMREALAASGAKYIAYCEGDDYWTDPLKLQKQVDFLETHPNYSMCHTGFEIVDEYSNRLSAEYLDEKIASAKRIGKADEYRITFYQRSKERLPKYKGFMEESCCGERFWFLLVKHNYIITATCLIRKEVTDQSRIGYYDYGLFLTAARLGKIGYIDDITASYRFQPNSAMTNPELFKKTVLKRGAFNTWGELKRVFDNNTCYEIMTRPGAKKMLVRKIFGLWFNSPEYRKEYLTFILSHPSLWYDMARYCMDRHPKIEKIFDMTNNYLNGIK